MSKNFELLRQMSNNSVVPGTPIESIRTPNRQPSQSPRPVATDPGSEWIRARNLLKRNWRISAAFAAAVVVTVTTATLLMKPIYEPVARIEIDPPGAEAFSLENGNSGANEAEYLETNAQILQSDELAIAVIRALHLDLDNAVSGESKLEPAQQQASTDPT